MDWNLAIEHLLSEMEKRHYKAGVLFFFKKVKSKKYKDILLFEDKIWSVAIFDSDKFEVKKID